MQRGLGPERGPGRGLGTVIGLMLCLPAATVALLAPAWPRVIDGTNVPAIADAADRSPPGSVLLAQAEPAPPRWSFQRSTASTDLRRNKVRPPAFIAFSFRMVPPE